MLHAQDDESGVSLQLTALQAQAVEEKVFGAQSFFLRRTQQTRAGTIFRGNLRAKDASSALTLVKEAASGCPELKGVQFLLLRDPVCAPLLPYICPPLHLTELHMCPVSRKKPLKDGPHRPAIGTQPGVWGGDARRNDESKHELALT